MQREIEFRGKLNSNKWVYGSLVKIKNLQATIYFEVGIILKKLQNNENDN